LAITLAQQKAQGDPKPRIEFGDFSRLGASAVWGALASRYA